MNYEYTDKIIAYIDKQLIGRYSRLKSLVSFDELNVLQEVNALYSEADVIIRKAYLKLAKKVYADNLREKSTQSIDQQWVDELLDAYDPVSKYVFSHEEDRKRARLIEALIASTTKAQEVDAALRAMSFMCRIYAVRVTDKAVLQAFADGREDSVRWIAEKDEKTCSVCHARDGKVYRLADLPPKPHINCRCRYGRLHSGTE